MTTGGVQQFVLDWLSARTSGSGRTVPQSSTVNLSDYGIDSTDLLDLIMEVEERTGLRFEPDLIIVEGGITVAAIAQAFRQDQSPP